MRFYRGVKITLSVILVVLVMSTFVLSAFAVKSDISFGAFSEPLLKNAQGEAGDSESQNSGCPAITGFTPVSDGVKIQFTACEGAWGYNICVKNGNLWDVIGTTNETTFTHNVSENNTTYTYTVVALDTLGEIIGSYNEEGWTNTYLSAPVLNDIQTTKGGLVVSWDAVEGASKYKVFVKTDSSWKAVGITEETSFTDIHVESGKKYRYTVRCINDDENKNTSYFVKKGISCLFLATPEIKKITNVAAGAKISWNRIDGAAGYNVYYKNGDEWTYIDTTAETNFVHNITTSNSTYIYTVRAVDKSGNYFSDYNKVGKSNTFLTVPVLKKTKNTTSGIRVSWEAVDGASKYKVFVKDGSSWKSIGTTKSTSFTHTEVTSGKRYKYTVRCITSDAKQYTSYFNTKGISHIHLSAPTGIKFSNVATGAKISWNKVTGATKYKIYIKNGSQWKYLGSTSKTNFIHKKAVTNTTYTYKVIAHNVNSGYSSGYYNGFSNLFIAPPDITSVKYKDGGYLLKWNAVPTVSKYRVFRKTDSSSWVKLADVSGTQYLDKTAKKSEVYMYTLRCLDENSKLISGFYSDNPYYYNGKPASNIIIGNSKSGYRYIGVDGVACETEEIQLAVDFLMKYGTGDTPSEKLKSAFMYMARNYPYNRSYDHPKNASDIGPLAVDIFKNKKGNCFRQAAALACLARVAGYRARIVTGETLSVSGYYVPHGWTEIYYNGKWRICDMNAQMRYSYLQYYMLDYHYWTIKPQHRYEVTVSKGKAVWQ